MNLSKLAHVKSPGSGHPAKKEWTVLIYSVADNALGKYMQQDMSDLSMANPGVHLVGQIADLDGQVNRLELREESRKLQNLGRQVDMTRPASLADSIQWAQTSYPSEKFMVVLSGHGAGWRGANYSQTHQSVADLAALQKGFELAFLTTGRKPDIVGLDQSSMATVEVAHQLKDCARLLVASQELEAGAAWQYGAEMWDRSPSSKNRLLQSTAILLQENPGLNPEQLAAGLVNGANAHACQEATMTALQLDRVPPLTDALDRFSHALLDHPEQGDLKKLKGHRSDLSTVARLSAQIFGGKVAEAAQEVQQKLADSILTEHHDHSTGHRGLSIHTAPEPDVQDLNPSQQALFSSDYGQVSFAQQTAWGQVIQKLSTKT